MFQTFFRQIAPLGVLASTAALVGCDGASISINGQKGVPLSEMETAGPAPTELVLSSGDTVILSDGETFALTVEGEDTESLRFVKDAEVIGITREDNWKGNSVATIRITMPPPKEVVIAGSGTVKAQSLASTADLNTGGSGKIEFAAITAESLSVNIGRSGAVKGLGTARRLEVNIGGSGDVALDGLKADRAEVSIGGAGDVAFASDGVVEANIAGSGDVTVTGTAKCTVNAFGSGTLTCAPAKAPGASPAPSALAAPTAKPAE